ncbi:MAG: hypothetical protein IJK42_14790 [Prevotella sp.]|nr:hypothetical protein [Prevotella sp.]
MALSITAIPVIANDYLKIYFKDGHTERHYMHLVESISTTKFDLEGNLHDDYQMQQIIMPDTTYSYYLADIDSMSFKKVDEEQLKQDIENVTTSLKQIYLQSSNIEEMASHIDDIRNLDGVEDVRQSGSDLIVQIRDWHNLYFTFHEIHQKPETPSGILTNMVNSINRKKNKPLHPVTEDGTPIKVAIAFQMVDNYEEQEDEETIRALNNKFSTMGFDAHFVPNELTGEILDVDFYKRRMFDYNVIYVSTHGSYSEGKHGFLTGERFANFWNLPDERDDMEDISFSPVYYKDEKNDGIFYYEVLWYKRVSEDVIRKSKSRFDGAGPHIVFMGACESLNGDGTLTREHKGIPEDRRGSRAVADIFIDKGTDVYLGYNEKTKHCDLAADEYFSIILNGGSLEGAFHYLNKDLKDEKTSAKAALIDIFKNSNSKGIFLVKTQTLSKTEQEAKNEYLANGQVNLTGSTSIYNASESGPEYYGFRLGNVPNVETLEEHQYQELKSNNIHYTGTGVVDMEFSAVAYPHSGQIVYYRAFTHDGIHYNWGEERHFTVYDALAVSANAVSLKVGESSSVEIISGSGNYTVVSDDEDVAIARIYDNATIEIKGMSVGTVTITVTDTKSGQTVTIEVTIVEDETPIALAVSANAVSLKVGESSSVEIISGNGDYTVTSDDEDVAIARVYDNATVRIKGVSVGSATIIVTDTKSGQTATIAVTVMGAINPDVSPEGVEAIDLGLPSGTKWANCNVGATKPEEYGGYYAWGETEEKDYYNKSTYQYYQNYYFVNIGNDISGTEYDVAHVKWGGDWVMPTLDEIKELYNNCTYGWTTINNVNGCKFTGPNGNSIFLPAAGYHWDDWGNDGLIGTGSNCSYWSSTRSRTYTTMAYYLYFEGIANRNYYFRDIGRSVRPVVRN